MALEIRQQQFKPWELQAEHDFVGRVLGMFPPQVELPNNKFLWALEFTRKAANLGLTSERATALFIVAAAILPADQFESGIAAPLSQWKEHSNQNVEMIENFEALLAPLERMRANNRTRRGEL